MKYKFLTLSLLLAGVCATTIKAQETNYYTPKWSDNIFISVGGGIHSVANFLPPKVQLTPAVIIPVPSALR